MTNRRVPSVRSDCFSNWPTKVFSSKMCALIKNLLILTCRDGVMDPAGPKPCAAVQGTTITVEDLFYNVPTRKKVPHCFLTSFKFEHHTVGRNSSTAKCIKSPWPEELEWCVLAVLLGWNICITNCNVFNSNLLDKHTANNCGLAIYRLTDPSYGGPLACFFKIQFEKRTRPQVTLSHVWGLPHTQCNTFHSASDIPVSCSIVFKTSVSGHLRSMQSSLRCKVKWMFSLMQSLHRPWKARVRSSVASWTSWPAMLCSSLRLGSL